MSQPQRVSRSKFVSPSNLIRDSKKIDTNIIPALTPLKPLECPTCKSVNMEKYKPILQEAIEKLLADTKDGKGENQKEYLRNFYKVDVLVFYLYQKDEAGKLTNNKIRATLNLS